jgi:hypothetical protein
MNLNFIIFNLDLYKFQVHNNNYTRNNDYIRNNDDK